MCILPGLTPRAFLGGSADSADRAARGVTILPILPLTLRAV